MSGYKSRITKNSNGKNVRLAHCDDCGQEFDVYYGHECDSIPQRSAVGCFFPVLCSVAIVLVVTVCLILDKQINPEEYPTLAPEPPPAQSILDR